MPNKHMLYEIFSLCFAEQWLCEALGNIRGDFEKEYQFIFSLGQSYETTKINAGQLVGFAFT